MRAGSGLTFFVIFVNTFLYFKLTDTLNLFFEFLRWKKLNFNLILTHSAQGKSRAPEVAVRSGYHGQTRIVLLWFRSCILFFTFVLVEWTFIFFFSHDFSLFWLCCSLGFRLGKQHWTWSGEKMINDRQNCIQRALYLGGRSLQWNPALENSRQMVCEIVDKLLSLNSLNECFHENTGLISPCIM